MAELNTIPAVFPKSLQVFVRMRAHVTIQARAAQNFLSWVWLGSRGVLNFSAFFVGHGHVTGQMLMLPTVSLSKN